MALVSLGTLRDYWKRVYDWIGSGLEPKVQLTGSFVRESTEPFPQGVEGNDLLLWDTGQVFVHDGTEWREI